MSAQCYIFSVGMIYSVKVVGPKFIFFPQSLVGPWLRVPRYVTQTLSNCCSLLKHQNYSIFLDLLSPLKCVPT